MFRFCARAKQARTVSSSIGQLFHMLSAGYESHGPKSPERLLRGLGTEVVDEMMGKVRVVRALVPMTTEPEQAMWVSLLIEPDSGQTLMLVGDDEYLGFSLTCRLPLHTVIVGLQPPARRPMGKQARLLYAACMTMPNAVKSL
jgi:hypothetical protein